MWVFLQCINNLTYLYLRTFTEMLKSDVCRLNWLAEDSCSRDAVTSSTTFQDNEGSVADSSTSVKAHKVRRSDKQVKEEVLKNINLFQMMFLIF